MVTIALLSNSRQNLRVGLDCALTYAAFDLPLRLVISAVSRAALDETCEKKIALLGQECCCTIAPLAENHLFNSADESHSGNPISTGRFFLSF